MNWICRSTVKSKRWLGAREEGVPMCTHDCFLGRCEDGVQFLTLATRWHYHPGLLDGGELLITEASLVAQ